MKKPSKKAVALIATLVVAVGGLGCYAASHAHEGEPRTMKIERHETEAAPVEQAAPEETEVEEEAPAIDFVTDEAFLLSDEEQASLEAQAQTIYDNYGFEVHVATVSDTGGFTDTYRFAKSFYNKHDFGKNGLLLMVSMDNMDFIFVPHGEGKKVLTDYGNEKMSEACLEYFATEDWVPGFQCYLEKAADYCYQYYVNGKAFDKPAKKASPKKPAEKKESEDREEQNLDSEKDRAYIEATECLNEAPYSREGLIEELQSRGFSDDAIAFGLDHCFANWYEQAMRMAHDYMDSGDYSEDEVIDYLLSKGFTQDEAENGVAGLDFGSSDADATTYDEAE